MNNFFDYNIDTKQYNGSAYEKARTKDSLWQEWQEINKKYEKQITNYAGYLPFSILPLPLQLLTGLGMILSIPYIFIFPILGRMMKISQNAPWNLIIGFGIGVLGITVLLLLYLIIMKILHNKKDHTELRKEKNRIQKKILEGFHISSGIDYFFSLDVLSVEYRQNSKGKTIDKKYKRRYRASTWTCFLQNDTLYITDYQYLFAIEIPKLQTLSFTADTIYMANSTACSDKADIFCYIPGYYKVKGYGRIQIGDSDKQLEILVPAYIWGIKEEIEEYQKALKVHLKKEELVFYWSSGCFINENISWDNYCECCVKLEPKALQEEYIEQVKADFLMIMSDTSAWNKKLLSLLEKKTGKGKKAYQNNEIELLGFQVKSGHNVSFWYDNHGEDIEICGSIEDDMWTVSKRESCELLE